uniref:Uncharacterized protein n=1 Tax=Salmo trutta TaxID=8032 RepID=A0A673Z1S5_SALTR
VHPLNDVSAVVEDAPDVFSVHCAGEMGITIVPSVSTGCMYQKLITYEVLCPFDQEYYCISLTIIWRSVACKLWEILFNFRFPCQHLLYVLEEVEGLLQSVGLIVFPDHHVVAAAGHHEYNGRHIWRDRQGERITTGLDMIQDMFMDNVLHSTLRRGTTTGYLLLCTVDQLVLIGSLEAGLHPLVLLEKSFFSLHFSYSFHSGNSQNVSLDYLHCSPFYTAATLCCYHLCIVTLITLPTCTYYLD